MTPPLSPRVGPSPDGATSHRRLVPLVGGTRPGDVATLLGAVRATVVEDAPGVLVPHAPGRRGSDVVAELSARLRRLVPGATAMVLQTSGSTTGRGHLVALGAAALTASARATEKRLAGPGQWLLAVPAHHVAGVQVLVRSALAGTRPVVLDTSGGFDATALAEAATTMREDIPGYLSLVPTQLLRVLEAGERAAEPLRRLAAILVGGAASAPSTLERARDLGLPVVTTYGMTETGGGCVYDGVALDGVRLRILDDDRVAIGGPVLASAYLDDDAADAAVFRVVDGVRWLYTADRGRLDARGDGPDRLSVLGRIDDLINSGGVKVSPGAVERALAELPGVAEAVVVGVPDPEWGALVTAVVVPTPGAATPTLADIRAAVGACPGSNGTSQPAGAHLDGAHRPRALVVMARLPERGPGKVDRIEAARLAAAALAGPARVGVERHGG
ncbi:AMP-binding protein [Georgenia sp.]